MDEGFVLCGERERCLRGCRVGRVGDVGCGVEDGEGDDENDDTTAGENGEEVSDAHMVMLCAGEKHSAHPPYRGRAGEG